MSITPTQQQTLNPNLMMADQSVNRYPNQFFDLSQQYMPPTIKELFRWCTFYFYNSPLIGSALKKMSRYPITDLIIEDEQDSIKDLWDHIFNKCIKIKDRMLEMNLDEKVYGNCFISLHLPITRFLKCNKCGNSLPIKQWDWRFGSSYKFIGKCVKCGNDGELTVKDIPYKDIKSVRLLRWSPENIEIKYNEYTGRYIYLYTVPRKLRLAVQAGDKDIIEDLPTIVIDAIKDQKKIKMNPDNFRHLKSTTLAEQDQGWGKPLIIHVLKDMFYFYTLRRAQEAIAMEHIIPFDILYPMPNAQMDPYVHSNLGSWKSQIEQIIAKHRKDPNFKAVIPIPIGYGRIGGDGKALLLGPELQYLTQTIVGGMGIPQEFLFGGLNWCLHKKSYISSSSGLLRLEEICPDHIGFNKPAQDISVATKDGVQKIALVHTTEKKPQRSFKTKMGLKLTGSPIHKLWVLNKDVTMGWKDLNDIKSGEFVAVARKTDIWGTETPSPELCRLMGYLVSEGSCTDRCMEFSNTDESIVADYAHCFEKVFGDCPKAVWRETKDWPGHYGKKPIATIRSSRQDVMDMLDEHDMKHYAETKQIPRIIRSATKECVFEFLKALFEGDGCCPVRTEKQSILYGSISEQLLEEIQLLLLNAGIVSHRYPRYDDMIPTLHISSIYAAMYMEQIGFVSDTKNNAFNALIQRDGFRCDSQKYPYLLDNLKELKKKTNGCGAWIKGSQPVIEGDGELTAQEVADILGREVSSVRLYIKNGKLKARKEERADGRFCGYFISKEDLRSFVNNHGISKRASVGQTTWDINTNNIDHVNWDGVKELDPVLYDNIQALLKSDFIWDEVVEKSESIEEIEMCDLTVFETHSYVANGFISHNTGSSVSLRTLENDFIQNRSQLLDTVLWIKDKIRSWLNCPDVQNIRFAEFRMADDIQRNQQVIGLNAQGKLSDQTMLTELGYNFEDEVKKRLEEAHIQNAIMEIQAKGQAKLQGESQVISFNFQQKIQELAAKAQQGAALKMNNAIAHDNTKQITAMVEKLVKMDPAQAEGAIADMKVEIPEIAAVIEQNYETVMQQQQQAQDQQIQAQQQQEQMQQEQQMQMGQQQQQQDMQLQQAQQQQDMQLQGQQEQQISQYATQKAIQQDAKKSGINMDPAPKKQPPRRQGGV